MMKEGGCVRTDILEKVIGPEERPSEEEYVERVAEKLREDGWYMPDIEEERHVRNTDRAIAAIREEVIRQDSKWGTNRRMPSFTEAFWGELMPEPSEAKDLIETLTHFEELTWEDILFEELCEAHAEKDDVEALCIELIQSAAIIVQ